MSATGRSFSWYSEELERAEARIEHLETALRRLGSIKAMDPAQNWTLADEVQARCDFARRALDGEP